MKYRTIWLYLNFLILNVPAWENTLGASLIVKLLRDG